ncbi:HNH endonuclease [Streptomyces liliifuscus]|uniref:HNH endonuclease n=1 Tax=Streptomyces liliifuscus TaxID=2797636 RepID=A0A7T7I903_9ACTN|nr:HNH endonuclease signature motif containing protein [Streptomyces liliifuscus]QQM43078.1 HNH endonuclease [Streptomyces liliifuscus]
MAVSPYTRERLEEAASSSRTLSEALGRLGVDPKSSTRDYIRGRMKKLGVDTAHFQREGTRWTREVLVPAVAASKSVNDVLRHLGLDLVGGHHTNITRRIKAYGLDTSHFCPRAERPKGNRRQRTTDQVLVQHESKDKRREHPDRLKRALLDLGTPEQCSRCGTEPLWRGRPLPLEVDHVDGNWRNNRPENLRLLCPNCHAATDSYRGRSKRHRTGTAT